MFKVLKWLILITIWALTLPYSLIVWPVGWLILKLLRKILRWRPFSRETQLRSPEEATIYVLKNISKLTFWQIGDIEKGVGNYLMRHRVVDSPMVVLYGCRIIKPLEGMKDLQKMASRWNGAWNGPDVGRPGILHQKRKWIQLCGEYLKPFTLLHVQRAVASQRKMTLREALDLFDPRLS